MNEKYGICYEQKTKYHSFMQRKCNENHYSYMKQVCNAYYFTCT